MIVSKESNRRTAIWLVAIFFGAFIIRFIFAISLPPQALWSDETGYLNIAINLCSGKGYTNEGIRTREHPFFSKGNINTKDSFFFAPGTTFMLAFLVCTVGQHIEIFRIFQSFLVSFIPICVFLLSIRLFESRKIAFISAIISIIYPYYVYISPLFIPQTIFSVLLVLCLYFFVSWLKEGNIIWLIMTGVVNGIACLFVVPMIFTLIPICMIILFRSGFKVILLKNLITFATCWAVTVGPYMTYASIKNERFIMITKSGEGTIIKYNYPGISAFDILSHSMDRKAQEKIKQLYWDLTQSSKKNSVSIEFLKRIVVKQPLFFIRNCFLRLIALFSPITYTITKNNYSKLLGNFVGYFVYFPLFLLSIAGMLKMIFRRNWMGLQLCSLLIFFLIPYIMIIASTRYRLPLDSVIIIFATYFIVDKNRMIFDTVSKRISKKGMGSAYAVEVSENDDKKRV